MQTEPAPPATSSTVSAPRSRPDSYSAKPNGNESRCMLAAQASGISALPRSHLRAAPRANPLLRTFSCCRASFGGGSVKSNSGLASST